MPARQAHHPERLVLSECTPANLVHFLLRYSRKNESTSEALSPPYINQKQLPGHFTSQVPRLGFQQSP